MANSPPSKPFRRLHRPSTASFCRVLGGSFLLSCPAGYRPPLERFSHLGEGSTTFLDFFLLVLSWSKWVDENRKVFFVCFFLRFWMFLWFLRRIEPFWIYEMPLNPSWLTSRGWPPLAREVARYPVISWGKMEISWISFAKVSEVGGGCLKFWWDTVAFCVWKHVSEQEPETSDWALNDNQALFLCSSYLKSCGLVERARKAVLSTRKSATRVETSESITKATMMHRQSQSHSTETNPKPQKLTSKWARANQVKRLELPDSSIYALDIFSKICAFQTSELLSCLRHARPENWGWFVLASATCLQGG